MKQPFKEGISGERRLYGDEAAGPPLEKIKSGATLRDLQADYAMFTYAPLCVLGGIEHNPVQEWINIHNHPQIVFILQLDTPYIHIRKDTVWDRVLWLVEKEFKDSLFFHLASMAFIDRGKKQLSRVICQEMPAPDVVALKKGPRVLPPLIAVHTFSVDTNLGCFAFVPGGFRTEFRPYVQFYPAREETIKLAEAMLTDNVKPYDGIQPLPWESTDEDPDTPATPNRG